MVAVLADAIMVGLPVHVNVAACFVRRPSSAQLLRGSLTRHAPGVTGLGAEGWIGRAPARESKLFDVMLDLHWFMCMSPEAINQ